MPFSNYQLSIPVGGLATTYPIDGTPAEYARNLINLVPENGKLRSRNGSENISHSDQAIAIKTIFHLTLDSGLTRSVFINSTAGMLSFMDLDTLETVTGTTTPTNTEWQWVNYKHRLFAVNGINNGQTWTGLAASDFTDIAYTGIATASLINVSIYKQRIYFVEKNSSSVWYSGSNTLAGALTEVDFDSFLKRGGSIISCGSWSNNQNVVAQDLFYVYSSNGELLLYQGDSPSASDWRIVSRFYIGKPLGYRCSIDIENDTVLITDAGLFSLNALINQGVGSAVDAISKEINLYIREAAKLISFSYQWSGVYNPKIRRLYITLPYGTDQNNVLACNWQTRAWCFFTFRKSSQGYGEPLYLSYRTGSLVANNFETGGQPIGVIAGSISYILNLDAPDVFIDFAGVIGEEQLIAVRVEYPYFSYGDASINKKFKDVYPIVFLSPETELNVSMFINFEANTKASIIETTGSALYFDMFFDFFFPAEGLYFDKHVSLFGIGKYGSLVLYGDIAEGYLEINSMIVGFETGGVIH